MDPILKGLLTGLVLSVYVGATFFMLMETSIKRGFKAALYFDLGIFISDLLCIVLVYFFASEMLNVIMTNLYVGLFGGVAFIGYGVSYMRDRQITPDKIRADDRKIKLLFNGFFINLVNPSVFVFWLGTLAIALSHFHFTGREVFVYFATTLSVVVIVDILKIYSACWLRSKLTPRLLKLLYLISGALLILFGVVVIINKIRAF